MIWWVGGCGDVLCASTLWDHRESNNLQHPVYNIRWQIRDSSPHQPIHFSNQHIKTTFLKHFSGLKKEDSEPLLALRTNSFISFNGLLRPSIMSFFPIDICHKVSSFTLVPLQAFSGCMLLWSRCPLLWMYHLRDCQYEEWPNEAMDNTHCL